MPVFIRSQLEHGFPFAENTIDLHINALQCLVYGQTLYLCHSLKTHIFRQRIHNHRVDHVQVCKLAELYNPTKDFRRVILRIGGWTLRCDLLSGLTLYSIVMRLCDGGGTPPLWRGV